MADSDILAIPQISFAQNNKYLTHNNAIDKLEQATNGRYTNTTPGASTIVIGPADATRYFTYEFLVASAPRTVTFPKFINSADRRRFFAVLNRTAHTLTVTDEALANSVTLAAGTSILVYQYIDTFVVLGKGPIDGVPALVDADIGLFVPATPPVSSLIGSYTFARGAYLLDNFAGSVGRLEVPPTVDTTLDVYRTGVLIGTVTLLSGGGITFATSGTLGETFATSDSLNVRTQASVNGFSGLSLTFKGYLS